MGVAGLFRQVRVKTFWRSISHANGSRKAQYIFSALFGLLAFASVFFFALLGFRALLAADAGLGEGLLAGICTASVPALVVAGTATAIYAMYLSEDLDLLASMPLREGTIFAYKFWETLIGGFTVFAIFALPALLAYGVAVGANVAFYPVLAATSVLLLMVPTALCVMLVVPLMRVLPASKAREIVGALGLLAFGGFYAAQQWFLNRSVPQDVGASSSLRTLAEAPLLNVPPGTWAADALAGAASAEPGRLLSGLLPLAALAAGAYAVCLPVTGWAYATGRARAKESGGRVRSSGWATALFGPLPADVRAVAAKDLVVLPRDLQRLAVMIVPVAMLVPVVFINSDLLSSFGRAGPASLLLVPHLSVGVLGALISLQVGSLAVSLEGRPYWFLAASPLSPWRLLAGKCAAAAAPGLLVAVAGSVFVSVFFGLYPPGLLLGLAGGVAASAVVSLYAVGISALFPRFDWENPNRATTPAAAILGMVCLLVLALFAGLLVALALNFGDPLPVWTRLLVACALWSVVSAVPGYALFAAGARNLEKLEWDL